MDWHNSTLTTDQYSLLSYLCLKYGSFAFEETVPAEAFMK